MDDDLNDDNHVTEHTEDEQPEVIFLQEGEEEGTSYSQEDDEEEDNTIEEEQSININDDSITRIEAHKKDVFCLALAKDGKWLATGSEDDTAAVWDLTQKPLRQHFHIVGKHVDSVHCLAWNCSSDLLASGDMSGRIVCCNVMSNSTDPDILIIEDCQSSQNQINEVEELENSFEHIRWLLWHPTANGILFSGTGDGSIWMWLIIIYLNKSLSIQQFKVFPNSSNSPCVASQFLQGAKHFLSVYEDAIAKIWDLKTSTCISEIDLPGTCTGAIDLNLAGNVAAIGCSNGLTALISINLIDSKLKLIHVFTCLKKESISENIKNDKEDPEDQQEKNQNSVECIKFFPGNFPWLAIGMSNGILTIFNWEHPAGRYELFNEGEAVIDCIWKIDTSINNFICLISICVNGIICIWDAKNGQILNRLEGGRDQIFSSLKFNDFNDGIERLFTGCERGLLRIFEIC